MFVILTSKPGQYRTELGEGVRPLEAYDFRFGGRTWAQFQIAELLGDAKIRVVDEAPPPVVNEVPVKFFEKFETIEAARRELNTLVGSGRVATELVPRA